MISRLVAGLRAATTTLTIMQVGPGAVVMIRIQVVTKEIALLGTKLPLETTVGTTTIHRGIIMETVTTTGTPEIQQLMLGNKSRARLLETMIGAPGKTTTMVEAVRILGSRSRALKQVTITGIRAAIIRMPGQLGPQHPITLLQTGLRT